MDKFKRTKKAIKKKEKIKTKLNQIFEALNYIGDNTSGALNRTNRIMENQHHYHILLYDRLNAIEKKQTEIINRIELLENKNRANADSINNPLVLNSKIKEIHEAIQAIQVE